MNRAWVMTLCPDLSLVQCIYLIILFGLQSTRAREKNFLSLVLETTCIVN
jgi:hypothetical protein